MTFIYPSAVLTVHDILISNNITYYYYCYYYCY